MTSPEAIEVSGLGKQYTLGARAPFGRQAYARFSEALVGAVGRPLRALRGGRSGPDRFWALREVSFAVGEGEVVGVIGGNGAGKSTLLKILARITEPTTGEARLRGRLGSLLEVGTGFHPELTGRENVFMSGAILGMRRDEIRRRFDEIVAFSELERFLDTPVKRYSSGMYVRLAFAVAAHFEPEILLVDEVLAVGDVGFQQRCLGKMSEASRSGRTVLFVSHNMGAVQALCERVVVLDGGRVDFDGPSGEGIERYLRRQGQSGAPFSSAERRFDAGEADDGRGARVEVVRLGSVDGERRSWFSPAEPVGVEVVYAVDRPLRGLRLRVWITTPEGIPVLVATDHALRGPVELPGRRVSRCLLPGGLFNTRAYRVAVELDIPGVEVLVQRRPALELSVAGAGNQDSVVSEPWPGVVAPGVTWDVVGAEAEDSVRSGRAAGARR